mgnify:CR=1 FL=1
MPMGRAGSRLDFRLFRRSLCDSGSTGFGAQFDELAMPDSSRHEDDPEKTRFSFEVPDGASEELQAKVEALRQPSSYPGDARSIETVETHMSWVFLTEFHAYKLKKPIRTRWLDHTTIDARKSACETELELNRRLAPDVYLAVVPVVDSDRGLRVEADGEPVDWLVKMRRLPEERMLDACIEHGEVREAEVDAVASVLSDFYERTESAPLPGTDYVRRLNSDIESKRKSLEQPRYRLASADIRAVAEGLERWADEFREILEVRSSKVVDAHGDLRPEHVCLESAPVIIDCLEFDRSLRLLDPVSELSFLALECERLGADWIGDHLLDAYRKSTGDDFPPPLVRFYKSYHALVRAAVAVWHLDDHALDHFDKWRKKGTRYLNLAPLAAS